VIVNEIHLKDIRVALIKLVSHGKKITREQRKIKDRHNLLLLTLWFHRRLLKNLSRGNHFLEKKGKSQQKSTCLI